jgi:tetratricopeptide (TPR) repeat protein
MKKTIYISLLFLFAIQAFGQNKVSNALYSLKNNELEKAKELIDAATIDTVFIDLAHTWYYKGHIYKGLFQRDEVDSIESPKRKEAIDAFKKCMELEPEGQYFESSRKGIKYLATTIYNQAAASFGEDSYVYAIKTYEYYKEVMRYAYPDTDFIDKDIMFKLGLSSIYNRMAEKDSVNSKMHIAEAEKVYKEVLDLDSNNMSANYNLGIIYYNQGVDIVNNMDYSLDLMELTMIQDEIIDLFRMSLPYMKKAYDLNPTRKATLIGLQGIYFSLNDIPQSEAYKKELEVLESEPSPEQDVEVDEEVQD